ncbi:MAG TPA: hypothetical protein VIG90_09230 [Pedomonas sp.]|uniref:hypothetical protein n=1 Tax=Pedomonas sp. TaxID=2976421 RepID=UPI002F413418
MTTRRFGIHRRSTAKAGGLGLACLLLAATPALGAAPETFTAQTARAPTTALAMNDAAGPQAFTTVLPEAQRCPQAADRPMPPAEGAATGAKESPCLGRLTDKLLGLAARKAGQFLSVPVLVF